MSQLNNILINQLASQCLLREALASKSDVRRFKHYINAAEKIRSWPTPLDLYHSVTAVDQAPPGVGQRTLSLLRDVLPAFDSRALWESSKGKSSALDAAFIQQHNQMKFFTHDEISDFVGKIQAAAFSFDSHLTVVPVSSHRRGVPFAKSVRLLLTRAETYLQEDSEIPYTTPTKFLRLLRSAGFGALSLRNPSPNYYTFWAFLSPSKSLMEAELEFSSRLKLEVEGEPEVPNLLSRIPSNKNTNDGGKDLEASNSGTTDPDLRAGESRRSLTLAKRREFLRETLRQNPFLRVHLHWTPSDCFYGSQFLLTGPQPYLDRVAILAAQNKSHFTLRPSTGALLDLSVLAGDTDLRIPLKPIVPLQSEEELYDRLRVPFTHPFHRY
jgi:hypothetical protein